jgi:hypothetical protein
LPDLLPPRSSGSDGETAQHQGTCAKMASAQAARIIPGYLKRGFLPPGLGLFDLPPATSKKSGCRGVQCDSKSTALTNQCLRHNWF